MKQIYITLYARTIWSGGRNNFLVKLGYSLDIFETILKHRIKYDGWYVSHNPNSIKLSKILLSTQKKNSCKSRCDSIKKCTRT